MKNEYENTAKLRQALEQGCLGIDANIAARLAEARNKALDHQNFAVAEVMVANAFAHAGGRLSQVLLPNARMLTALAALTFGIVGTYYWNAFEQADENEEVDSALLADDLPVDSYTDQGFEAWLEHSKQSSSQ